MNKYLSLIALLLITVYSSFFQNGEKTYKIRTLAFYNLENLFDTINDVTKNDEASPMMELKGNKSKVYWDKIDKLASVISQIGEEKTNTSPAIIGVSEIENVSVLEDLVKSVHIKKKNYGIIHYESPDKRGIDVALLYQKRYFKPIFHQSFNPNIYRNNRKVYTRDQLLVSGYLDDELIQNKDTTFFAKVKGQSMINAGLNDSDLLVIDRSLEPKNNKIAVCFLDGEFTVKRLRVEKNEVWLQPENPDYPIINITEDNNFIIWGIVTNVIKKV